MVLANLVFGGDENEFHAQYCHATFAMLLSMNVIYLPYCIGMRGILYYTMYPAFLNCSMLKGVRLGELYFLGSSFVPAWSLGCHSSYLINNRLPRCLGEAWSNCNFSSSKAHNLRVELKKSANSPASFSLKSSWFSSLTSFSSPRLSCILGHDQVWHLFLGKAADNFLYQDSVE